MSKHGTKAKPAPTDSEVFQGFVFNGQQYSPQRIEQAVQAVQRQLDSAELNRVNDALLSRLDRAKKAHRRLSKRQLLADPGISSLVNALALVNQAWITSVIADTIRKREHLRGLTVEELYSTALTGAGTVGGVMNAILQYDYKLGRVDAFTTYLARAITNSLLATPKEKKTYKRVEARTRPIHKRDEEGREPSWVDRSTPRPERAAINRELLDVVQSVIPDLPTQQQRDTACWMIERILETGELPMAREAAAIQRSRVSRERGRQLMEQTINSIRAQIEGRYPQLAEHGIRGWEEFKGIFTRTKAAAQNAGTSNGRAGRGA